MTCHWLSGTLNGYIHELSVFGDVHDAVNRHGRLTTTTSVALEACGRLPRRAPPPLGGRGDGERRKLRQGSLANGMSTWKLPSRWGLPSSHADMFAGGRTAHLVSTWELALDSGGRSKLIINLRSGITYHQPGLSDLAGRAPAAGAQASTPI